MYNEVESIVPIEIKRPVKPVHSKEKLRPEERRFLVEDYDISSVASEDIKNGV